MSESRVEKVAALAADLYPTIIQTSRFPDANECAAVAFEFADAFMRVVEKYKEQAGPLG